MTPPSEPSTYDWSGFVKGARAAPSLASLVMACSFIGFGAFLHSIGFGLFEGMATNVLIWALPGQVVFTDMWQKGAGLFLIALAVTFTAVRLMPMVVLVISRARVPGAPRWLEFLVAHFTAVTIWVMAERYIDDVPRRQRLPWLFGMGATLMLAMFFFLAAGFLLAERMPLAIAAAMVFLTPSFFLLSLFGSARWRFDYLAIGLGAAIGPVVEHYYEGIDLLVAGLVGGTIAYLVARPGRGRA